MAIKKKKKHITPAEVDRGIEFNLHTKFHLQRYTLGVGSRDPRGSDQQGEIVTPSAGIIVACTKTRQFDDSTAISVGFFKLMRGVLL